MTEAQSILVDIAISKWPKNVDYSIRGALHNVTIGLQDKFPPQIYDEIVQISLYGEMGIRKLLLDFDYLTCVDRTRQLDRLTDPGKKAQELGGHQAYLKWKEKEEREKRFEEFPKKKWHIYDLTKLLITIFITAIIAIPISYLKGRSDAQNSPANIRIPSRLSPPEDTALQKSKTLDKKDTLQKQVSSP